MSIAHEAAKAMLSDALLQDSSGISRLVHLELELPLDKVIKFVSVGLPLLLVSMAFAREISLGEKACVSVTCCSCVTVGYFFCIPFGFPLIIPNYMFRGADFFIPPLCFWFFFVCVSSQLCPLCSTLQLFVLEMNSPN